MPEESSPQNLAPSLSAIRRLLPRAKRTVTYLPLAFCLLVVMAVVQVLLPQVMRLAIDGPLTNTSLLSRVEKWAEIKGLGELFLGLLVLGFAANYLSTWLLQKFGQTLVLNLRQDLFAKLHRLPISYFDKHAVGRTVTRVVNDSNALSELFTSVLAAGLGDLILLMSILLVLVITDPTLCLILGLFCPLLVALVVWFRSNSAPLYKSQRSLLAQLNAFFAEILNGLSTVKSFQAGPFQRNRFSEINQAYLNNELHLLTLVARFRPGFAVARIAATGCLLTIGGLSVLEGTSTLGTLISSLLYIKLVFSPLEQLAERYNILIRATVASERVLAILDLEEEASATDDLDQLCKPELTIGFEDVSFHYNQDKPVLKNISFTLEPGQVLALVGPTGSGKSTIVSLLLGFYRLEHLQGHQGRIVINGCDLNQVQLKSWRRKLAFVSQDLFLFKGSIAKNVTLYEDLESEKVLKALEQADCGDFVAKLPDKEKTIVGEKGHALSTGQRQLLSFARALAFEPDLLILDEATANIDSETEAKVEEALDVLLAERQAIIVAHRLSTVKRADKILVLAEGSIKEQGSHLELMQLNGLYATMVRKAEASGTS